MQLPPGLAARGWLSALLLSLCACPSLGDIPQREVGELDAGPLPTDASSDVPDGCAPPYEGACAESSTCDRDCSPATCGDHTLNVTRREECDDGNLDPFDGCHQCEAYDTWSSQVTNLQEVHRGADGRTYAITHTLLVQKDEGGRTRWAAGHGLSNVWGLEADAGHLCLTGERDDGTFVVELWSTAGERLWSEDLGFAAQVSDCRLDQPGTVLVVGNSWLSLRSLGTGEEIWPLSLLPFYPNVQILAARWDPMTERTLLVQRDLVAHFSLVRVADDGTHDPVYGVQDLPGTYGEGHALARGVALEGGGFALQLTGTPAGETGWRVSTFSDSGALAWSRWLSPPAPEFAPSEMVELANGTLILKTFHEGTFDLTAVRPRTEMADTFRLAHATVDESLILWGVAPGPNGSLLVAYHSEGTLGRVAKVPPSLLGKQ